MMRIAEYILGFALITILLASGISCSKEYSRDMLPMPEGLEVIIRPAKFTSYPNTIYYSIIEIKSAIQLTSGDYYFMLNWDRGGRGGGASWILLRVV
jgi:hypothetical protein